MHTAIVLLAQATQPPPSMAGMLVPMVCIFAVMYFLMIRPQQQKQKKLQETIDALKTGDAVITVGGIHGVVSNVKDGATLTLKIADNVRVDVEKSAIATVLKQDGATKA
jgi:preprotein translocase subunit YajC